MRILICSPGDSRNIGDHARLISIINAIKENISEADIFVASRFPKKAEKKYNVNSITSKFSPDLLKSIRDADLLIYDAGIQDKTSQLYIPSMLSKVILSKILRTPVMMYGIGVGPLDTTFGKFITKLIVNHIDLITVRDEKSYEILKRVGVNKPPIYVTADPGIALPPATPARIEEILKAEGIERNRPLIAISPRRWFYCNYNILPTKQIIKWGLWPPGGKERFEKFENTMADVADHLVNKFGAEIVFVPTSLGDYQDDDKVAIEIMNKMENKKHAKIITNEYKPQEIKGILGEMELLIGARMHATILASTMGVPVIGISYSPKFESYFEIIGQKDKVIEFENVTFDNLIAIVEETWHSRKQIREELLLKVQPLWEKALSNVDFVRKMLREKLNL